MSFRRETWINIILCGGFLLLGVLSFFILKFTKPGLDKRPEEVRAPQLHTRTLKLKNLPIKFEAYGNTSSSSMAEVRIEVPGKIIFLSQNFREGGILKRGEVMIRIDHREYHLALEKARATQLAKEASLEQVLQERSNLKKSLELSRKNLTLNERELKRYKEMVKEHTVTEQAYENILQKVQQQRLQVLGHENALAQIPHKITLQKANIASARISVQEAMIRLERTEIRAPFTGKLNNRKGEVGEFLGMGASLGRLVNLESLELKIPVPQSEIRTLLGNSSAGIEDLSSAEGQIHIDDSRRFVKIDPVAPKGPGVLGKISRFGAAYDPKTRTLPVYIEFTNTLSKDNVNDLYLHPGTFCKVEFTGDMLESVYEVDRTALLHDRVQVIREGKVLSVPVKMARDQGATLWVRGAFFEGDELILRYTELFEDGKRVIAVPGTELP